MKTALALILACCCAAHAADNVLPVPIVFDTDMGNDVDDALALALLHSLENRGECRLIAVTITKDNRWSAPYIDLVNTFYGRPDIPIGMVKGSGVTPKDSDMIRVPSERKRADGTPVYPHRLKSGNEAADATQVLSRVLATQPDGSVVVVQVGFSTNMARLFKTQPELVRRKIRMLVMMAGNFAKGDPEFNVKMDIPAAKDVFTTWPTPIVVSGFEVGNSMLYPAASIEKDFSYVQDHPIADAYRNYMKMPYDRPTWDITAALYAVRPSRGYFSLSPPGRITVDAKGVTKFEPVPDGPHRYLTVDDTQRARALESMILLASEPPLSR